MTPRTSEEDGSKRDSLVQAGIWRGGNHEKHGFQELPRMTKDQFVDIRVCLPAIPGASICSRRSLQHLDPRVANQGMLLSATEFLEADVAFAGTILNRRRILAIVAFNNLVLLGKVEVLDSLAVKNHLDARAFEGDLVFVPICGFVELLGWRDGAVEPASQFRILRLRIVAKVGHLELQRIERRVTAHRRAQGTAAIAALAELELEFEDKVAVFFFAHQPGAARLAAVEHAFLNFPFGGFSWRIFDVVPGTDGPARRFAIFREEADETVCIRFG